MLTGSVRLHVFSGNESGGECFGYGASFSSYRPGADVIVEDDAGNVLAIGTLGEGTAVESTKGNTTDCLMSFEVQGIPASDFYVVHVAVRRVLSGGLVFSHQELEELGWEIALEVG